MVASIVLLTLRIQVAEVRKSAATRSSENHSLKLHFIILRDGSRHVADRNHSWKSYFLTNERNTFFFKLIFIDSFLRSARCINLFGSSLHILQLSPLIFLFFDFALSLDLLGLLCALDDLSSHGHDALVLQENVEVGAHILQHLDLLPQELLLLLDLRLDVLQEQVLRLLPLLEHAKQAIVEVVDGANLVHLHSHLFAF